MEEEDKIDAGIEDSMDCSDPTTASQPGSNNEPVDSSSSTVKTQSSWLSRIKGKLMTK